jgi:hypothetical protein
VSRLALTLVAVLALALPAGAGAASTVRFEGGTDQGLSVTFEVKSKKVRHFKAKVRCTGRRIQTFTYPTMPLSSRGRFSVHQAGPSIDGRVRGSHARGTLTLPGCDRRAGEVEFIANALQ